MKNLKKKGFTIVELVIVIAVIAVLAAVLIPTFSNVIQKANDSATIQEARNMYSEYVSLYDYTTGTPETNFVIKVDEDKFVAVVNGQLVTETIYVSKDAVVAANIGITDTSFVYEGTINNDDNNEEVTPPVGGEENETVAVTSVTLDKTTLSLNVDEIATLTATVSPTNATNKTVTWATSKEEVAKVDANGNVTAVAVGTAIITATADGKYATCEVTVSEVIVTPPVDDENPTAYSVTKNATNATIDGADSAVEGASYSATVVANDRYVIVSVTVVMNGQTVENAYSNETITISSVTGNIQISVVTALNFSNPNSEDWLIDMRLGGDGGQRPDSPGWVVSNYFSIENEDVIWVKNLSLETELLANKHSAFYGENKTFIQSFNLTYGKDSLGYLKELSFENEENEWTKFTINKADVKYMRLCGDPVSENENIIIIIYRNGEWLTA